MIENVHVYGEVVRKDDRIGVKVWAKDGYSMVKVVKTCGCQDVYAEGDVWFVWYDGAYEGKRKEVKYIVRDGNNRTLPGALFVLLKT